MILTRFKFFFANMQICVQVRFTSTYIFLMYFGQTDSLRESREESGFYSCRIFEKE